jgi:hypothetical protein
MSLALRPEVQALVRVRPVVEEFAHNFVPGPWLRLICSVLSSQARACRRNHQVPRVSLPDVGVTSISETCPVSSEDITPRSSLLQTHASIPVWVSSTSAFWPRSRSFCRLLPAPAATGILPTLSLRIFPRMPGPMPRRSHTVHLPVSSSVSSAFPWAAEDWLPASIRGTTFPRESFRGCRHFFMFKPPSLLASQVVPTAVHSATGQLRLLGPGRTCFVASTRTGHANRPNTGN